jgi:hypothetical protein
VGEALHELVLPAQELEELEQLPRPRLDALTLQAVEAAVEAEELRGGELLVQEGAVGDEARSADLAPAGSEERSCPSMLTDPEVGFKSPAMTRMVVVLPAPFGPRKPWISPGSTSRDTPATAVKEP